MITLGYGRKRLTQPTYLQLQTQIKTPAVVVHASYRCGSYLTTSYTLVRIIRRYRTCSNRRMAFWYSAYRFGWVYKKKQT